MANAKRDENSIHTMLASLNTDGVTPINVAINSTTFSIKVNDASTGTGFGVVNAKRDENSVPVLMGVASTTITVDGIDYVQGVTRVPIYADSSGDLLIDSN